MTTVLSVGNSDGSRNCDASCYNATGPKCECVCGGSNHGVGLQKAIENNCTRLGIDPNSIEGQYLCKGVQPIML